MPCLRALIALLLCATAARAQKLQPLIERPLILPHGTVDLTLQGTYTNWATGARKMAELVSAARAWENHIYYLAVNRVGDEAGFHYIGLSSAADYLGNVLHFAPQDEPAVFTIEVDAKAAAQKRVVHCHGEYEIDRVNWRRPELYGPLVEAQPHPFTGHFNS